MSDVLHATTHDLLKLGRFADAVTHVERLAEQGLPEPGEEMATVAARLPLMAPGEAIQDFADLWCKLRDAAPDEVRARSAAVEAAWLRPLLLRGWRVEV